MKRAFVLALALACCAALHAPDALAEQEIELDSVYARLRFPDTWLVVTPASLPVYAGLLRDAGQDPDAMETRFAADGVVAEGWSETFDESYRLIVREDERSQTLFDIGRSTGAQRRAIAGSFTGTRTSRQADTRYQDAEWSKLDALGWVLFLRYNKVEGGEITARGVQYFTIRNGKNYVLDWVVGARRVTNKDLARFREMLDGLSFVSGMEAPPIPARLEVAGGMPREAGSGELRLQGVTEPEAGLVLTRDTGAGEPRVMSIGSANRDGEFTLIVPLEEQGEYRLTLTAVKEGYQDASLSGTLTYQPGLLPVNIDNIPGPQYAQDSYRLSGAAPPGATVQIVAGERSLERKAGNDGSFFAEIDTSAPGDYRILVIVTHKGMKERRILIEFTRVASQAEERDALKRQAKQATYAQLLRNPETYVGEVMTFTGNVTEISHGAEVWFARLDVSRSKGVSWPMVLVCDADPGLKQGDRITFYARANSPFTEQDATGNEISVPSLSLLWLEK